MASELTSSPAELLAEAVNAIAGNSAASALTMSYAELWGAYYGEVVGGASPEKTMSIPAMMAGIANELGSNVSHLHFSQAELAAAIANAQGADPQVSALTSSPGRLLAAISNSAGGGGGGDVDFTGWSAGSQAGVYTDGVTGGKFPTGHVLTLGSDMTVEITQATHVDSGIEAITFTIANADDSMPIFSLAVPQQSAAAGETWRIAACVAADGDTLTEPGINAYTDADSVALLYPMDVGLPFGSSLQTAQGSTAVGSTTIDGGFDFQMPVGNVTISLALKLEQVA